MLADRPLRVPVQVTNGSASCGFLPITSKACSKIGLLWLDSLDLVLDLSVTLPTMLAGPNVVERFNANPSQLASD